MWHFWVFHACFYFMIVLVVNFRFAFSVLAPVFVFISYIFSSLSVSHCVSISSFLCLICLSLSFSIVFLFLSVTLYELFLDFCLSFWALSPKKTCSTCGSPKNEWDQGSEESAANVLPKDTFVYCSIRLERKIFDWLRFELWLKLGASPMTI